MKMTHIKTLSFLTVSCLLFWGCSDSSNESVTAPEVDNRATKDELTSVQEKASGEIANLKQKAEEEAAKLKSEVAAALKKQREELLSEMNANTSNLTSQMSGIKKQYESLKGALPDLESSITKLKDMAAKFDPSTIEELNAFKTKYQKEYELALGLMKKASELLENSGVKVPKLF